MDLVIVVMFLVYHLYGLVGESNINNPIVYLSNGIVQGERVTGERGNMFYSFKGVPFAEPPIGNLRFKPPIPRKPWRDVLIANKNGPPCPQFNIFTKSYKGDEDCLYINIYTPKLPDKNSGKMNVIYYIHGGGFLTGTSFNYGARRFHLEDVVLVTVNYRLSTLGFLSTNDSAARGNYGLLDQTEGLKWVRDNIHHFGGDPNRVTIMGESAGSASVIYQMLSPLSEGLFHQAIAMSGSALNPWALQKDPLYWTKRLGRKVNCPTDTSQELVECLRQKSAEELTKEGSVSTEMDMSYLTTAPTLDNYFIHDLPINIIRQRKHHVNVPLIIGTTKDEGTCFVSGRTSSSSGFTDKQLEDVLKQTLPVLPNVDNKIKIIKEKYFEDLKSFNEKEVIQRLRMALTDGMFQKCIFHTAKEMAASGTKTYFYIYDFDIRKSEPHGVCHAEDLYMFFDRDNHKLSLDEESQKMSNIFQTLIINFVKLGYPVQNDKTEHCEWPSCEADRFPVYHINLNCSLELYDETKDQLYNFWIKDVNEI